ncbi:MAG: hypothetical protein JKY53_09435 [Flavobacteriales bacterium]|nr:hypothetical protein [Flavobacteriales bacterium]
MQRIVILFASLVLVSSCSDRQKEEQGPIARVFDKYLYEDDISGLVPEGKSPEDSISIIKSYIDNWIREELILAQAEYNLPDEQEAIIEEDVNEYRTAKIVYAYERELIREKLDTSFSETEIQEYYHSNKKNFELKDYIVRGNYVKLEKNAPNKEQAIEWFNKGGEEEFAELKDYCFQYAQTFILDTARWIYFKELQKQSGIETLNVKDFLKENKHLEFEDEYYLHLLRIDEYLMKDSISPLALERENIRNILLNQRKLDLVKTMHNQIYKNALKKDKFEIFLKKE